MATFLGYIGTCFMIAFAYTMVIPFAIIGLTLMTFQLVNIVSIIGFASNFT